MNNSRFKVPEALCSANLTTPILTIDCSRANAYGRLVDGIDMSELILTADKLTSINPESNTYVPCMKELQQSSILPDLEELFGFMPIQIGFCNGPNKTLNGMEYHKSPELFIAVTDCVQFLCLPECLMDFSTCDAFQAEAFYFPKGSAFLLNPLVLHLAPCCVHPEGFKSIIVLPEGTNEPFQSIPKTQDPEAKILFKKNKWIIAHPQRTQLTKQGIHPGVIGENRGIHPIQ